MKIGFLWVLTLITLTAFSQSNQTSKNTLNEDTRVLEENIIKSVIDYFTLIKENDQWKILNGSYVSVPLEPERK